MLAEGVFTSTEMPPKYWIAPHNEMSYAPHYPNHLYFYCHQTATQLGATPIADARAIYQDLDPTLRDKLNTLGIRYDRFYHDKSIRMQLMSKLHPGVMSWRRSFGTEEKTVVEDKLKREGYDYHWLDRDRGLQTFIKLPAFRTHPITQETVWFNQSNIFNSEVFYRAILGPKFTWLFRYFLLPPQNLPCLARLGNGEELKNEEIENIIEVIQKNLIIEPWQQGDFMVVDNYLNLHAREPFTGPRKVMASLTA